MTIKFLIAGAGLALGLATPGTSQNFDIHRFCMSVAEMECQDWQALGYSDFASCGSARYDQCIQDVGWPGGHRGVSAPPALSPAMSPIEPAAGRAVATLS